MMDYQTAVRGAFFDIAGVAETPDEVAAQARYLDDGLLFLQEGKIIALLPWQEGEAFLHPLKGYVDLRGKLLLPGFVDAHVHYPQTEMIGAFGEQLLEWLTTYTFPVESQFADAEYAQEIAQFFVNQLISHGTTTALVFCTLHPASVEALFSEALRLNMRLIAGKVMMDRHVPDYLCETAGESYEQTRALIRRWHQRGRLGYAITPRFAPTSTPALLEAVQRLRASEAFYHATLGGARALRLEEKIGNFQPGKEADFVVIDPAVTPLQRLRIGRCHDIYEQLFVLMTLGDERNISETWVNGERVWCQD